MTRFTHAGVASGCASCHNGNQAPGKPARHVVTDRAVRDLSQEHRHLRRRADEPRRHRVRLRFLPQRQHRARASRRRHIVTTAPCETCHKSTVTFAGARLDHTAVTAPCATCHNGVTAEGKSPSTSSPTCPANPATGRRVGRSVTYRHASPRYPDHGKTSDCVACHVGNAQTVQWKFPAFQPDCAACHAAQFRPTAHAKFQKPMPVYYTVGGAARLHRRLPRLCRQHAPHRGHATRG